ncbi:MAG TPA: helical backbone metal receptor [Polyangiaceae bacterium]|nr:helical backbone metal receptor [Polyangiaceae bacterium]
MGALLACGSRGAGSVALGSGMACSKQRAPSRGRTRIVSLAPDLTHTLFSIGAGELVVGVSDYCQDPEAVQRLPRVGTSLTPNYEAITRLEPTLILSEDNRSARKRELSAIARAEFLPWLSLAEVAASIRVLGRLTQHGREANQLAERLVSVLGVPPPTAGPRVLLVLGDGADAPGELWFVRQNSLHGAALNAAGARNAVPEAVLAAPRLSYERLVQLDPDAILLLCLPNRAAERATTIGTLQRFETLSAVKRRRVGILESEAAFANGPRILTLVPALRDRLKALELVP